MRSDILRSEIGGIVAVNQISMTSLGVIVLAVASLAPVRADYIQANINNGANGISCGYFGTPSPGAPCDGAPAVNPVSASAANGALFASTDFGVDKLYLSTAGHADSQWGVLYSLSGAPIGTAVNLVVTFSYDVLISAGANSEVSVRMVVNNDTFSPFDIRVATDGLGDSCFDRAPQVGCSGSHVGTFSRTVSAQIGNNNRLGFDMSGAIFGSGLIDAAHTVLVSGITVPDGITWSYNSLTGNPLNFQYATTAATTPEPGSLALALTGFGFLMFVRRVRRSA